MQTLEGWVEQNGQRVGGKYYSTESSKIASWLILAGLFDMGVSPPKRLY